MLGNELRSCLTGSTQAESPVSHSVCAEVNCFIWPGSLVCSSARVRSTANEPKKQACFTAPPGQGSKFITVHTAEDSPQFHLTGKPNRKTWNATKPILQPCLQQHSSIELSQWLSPSAEPSWCPCLSRELLGRSAYFWSPANVLYWPWSMSYCSARAGKQI